MNTETIKRTRK